MLTFGSLFAGIGGIDLGFERAGLNCAFQVEIDDYANRVLEKHWPDLRRWRDIREWHPQRDEWHCDIIAGGDPCQRNSAAGRSTQQSLGGEFVRIVDAIRPAVVLRENPSKVRRDAPWPWWVMRSELESLGYAVLPFRLRACCVGAVHQRERLFLLGSLADADSNRLEGWARQAAGMEPMELAGLLATHDWPEIPADRGFDSRAGLPGYVDEVRCLGNAVVPQVAELIGRAIMIAVNLH